MTVESIVDVRSPSYSRVNSQKKKIFINERLQIRTRSMVLDKISTQTNDFGVPTLENHQNRRCWRASSAITTKNYVGNEVFRLKSFPGKSL